MWISISNDGVFFSLERPPFLPSSSTLPQTRLATFLGKEMHGDLSEFLDNSLLHFPSLESFSAILISEFFTLKITNDLAKFILQYGDRIPLYIYLYRLLAHPRSYKDAIRSVGLLGARGYNIIEYHMAEYFKKSVRIYDIEMASDIPGLQAEFIQADFFSVSPFVSDSHSRLEKSDLVISHGFVGWIKPAENSETGSTQEQFSRNLFNNVSAVTNHELLITWKTWDEIFFVEPFLQKAAANLCKQESFLFNRDGKSHELMTLLMPASIL